MQANVPMANHEDRSCACFPESNGIVCAFLPVAVTESCTH
jgi:hypothetical protein